MNIYTFIDTHLTNMSPIIFIFVLLCSLASATAEVYLSVILDTKIGGSFEFNTSYVDEFNKKHAMIDPLFKPTETFNKRQLRTDPVLVEMIQEYGHEMNGLNSAFSIQQIPEVFRNYYHIIATDKGERLVIDYNAYAVESINNIIQTLDSVEIQMLLITELIEDVKTQKALKMSNYVINLDEFDVDDDDDYFNVYPM